MRRPLLCRSVLCAGLLLAAGHAMAATAWVSNEKDNSLSLIDLQTLEVTPVSYTHLTLPTILLV